MIYYVIKNSIITTLTRKISLKDTQNQTRILTRTGLIILVSCVIKIDLNTQHWLDPRLKPT